MKRILVIAFTAAATLSLASPAYAKHRNCGVHVACHHRSQSHHSYKRRSPGPIHHRVAGAVIEHVHDAVVEHAHEFVKSAVRGAGSSVGHKAVNDATANPSTSTKTTPAGKTPDYCSEFAQAAAAHVSDAGYIARLHAEAPECFH